MTSTGRRMRAARIVASRKLALEDAPVPEPGARQVRFRVEGCGVCASNLGPWFGLPWTQYPLAPGEGGHEAWGVIDEVGAEVSQFRPGDRIAAVSFGAYAEYDVADQDALVRIPETLAGLPFPGEPLACAMNVFERAKIARGQTVAVIGIGFLGAILTRLAVQAGARVIAVSRRPFSLTVARGMGAQELVPLDDHQEIVKRVSESTHGLLCDRVIEVTGKQWPLDLAAELTRTRGTLVIAGYHQDGPRQVNMQLWNWRGLDVVNAHERELDVYARGMRSALEALAERQLDPLPLYTHRYSLEQLDQALDATAQRPLGFIKALVSP